MNLLIAGRGAPERGGIPTFLDWLVSTARAQGWTVTFVNLSPGADTAGGRWRVSNLQRSLKDAVTVARRTSAGDIVHIHTAMAPASTAVRAGLLCAAARVRGGRVLLHVHGGLLPLWATSGARRTILRLCASAAHHVATVSASTFQAVADVIGPAHTTLVRNGVDTERFHPGAPHDRHGAPVVLYVGHLSPRKGIGDLLDAADRLTQMGIDHQVLMVGGRPDEGASHAVQIDPSRHPTVRHRESQPTDAMPGIYREADLLCLPSWWEAMPLSVLEGMASGLPVVATDVGDVHTAVIEDRTGILVPPKTPESLADALASLLRDEALRKKMGRMARETAEQEWSAHATWSQILAIYRRLERP